MNNILLHWKIVKSEILLNSGFIISKCLDVLQNAYYKLGK